MLAALVASTGACATRRELVPASGYTSPAYRKSLAVESRGGVTVMSDGSVWHSSPENLPAEVTPVWVTVRNTTGRPVRVQYDEFTLRGPSGDRHAALAPYPAGALSWRPAFEVPNGGYFDGFEFLEHFKGDRERPPARVVLVTSEGREHERKRGMQAGATAFLTKPFTPEALAALLQGLLAQPVPEDAHM